MLELVEEGNTPVKKKDIPLIEVKELPSHFKCYPEGTEIFYEPIKMGELNALNSGTINVQRGMDFLLDAIHCNTMLAENLAYFDLIYIGILRKLHAFGDVKGTIGAVCPNCGNIVKHEFSYTDIEFLELAEDIEFPITATIGGEELEFGLITYKDFMGINSDDGVSGVYARMVKNKPYNEALEIIDNAYGEDIQIIKAIEHFLSYGIKPFTEICHNEIEVVEKDKKGKERKVFKECGAEVVMEVRSPFEVVFPDNRGFDNYKTKIHFGRRGSVLNN